MDVVAELKQLLEELVENNDFLELLQKQDWYGIEQYPTISDHSFSGEVDLYSALISLCWKTGIPTDKNPYLEGNILGDELFAHKVAVFHSIKIPNFITEIGYSAFENTGFEHIILNNNITDIDDSAFSDCWGLKDITLPTSLKKLGADVFYGCPVLEYVTIPKSVQSSGEYIFTNCEKLKEIIFKGTKKEADDRGLLDSKHLGIYHKVTVKCNDGDVVIGDK